MFTWVDKADSEPKIELTWNLDQALNLEKEIRRSLKKQYVLMMNYAVIFIWLIWNSKMQ